MAESESERAARLLQKIGADDFDFEALSEVDRHWLCHDLLPSIRRHGCYPPPPAGTVAITKNLPNPVRDVIDRVVNSEF